MTEKIEKNNMFVLFKLIIKIYAKISVLHFYILIFILDLIFKLHCKLNVYFLYWYILLVGLTYSSIMILMISVSKYLWTGLIYYYALFPATCLLIFALIINYKHVLNFRKEYQPQGNHSLVKVFIYSVIVLGMINYFSNEYSYISLIFVKNHLSFLLISIIYIMFFTSFTFSLKFNFINNLKITKLVMSLERKVKFILINSLDKLNVFLDKIISYH